MTITLDQLPDQADEITSVRYENGWTECRMHAEHSRPEIPDPDRVPVEPLSGDHTCDLCADLARFDAS